MKALSTASRTLMAALIAGGALFAAGSASAQSYYSEPQMIPVGVSISLGWHGDRYWDGHRYYAHDEWMRRHPHDFDPHHHNGHDHDHDDHRR